jgi:hypothetical protein
MILNEKGVWMAAQSKAEEIAPHVVYEFERLIEDARNLITLAGTIVSSGPALPGAGGDKESTNRALESLLLHARNVYDFFFVAPRKGFPDVSVQQYLEHGQAWTPDPAVLCPYLLGQQQRLNRSVPHLSYDRLK